MHASERIMMATGAARETALAKIGSFASMKELYSYIDRVKQLAPLAPGARRCVECLEPRGERHRCPR